MDGQQMDTDTANLIKFLHDVDVQAPPQLHERVNALIAERSTPTRRRGARRPAGVRLALGGGLAAAAVATAAIVIGSSTSSSSSGGAGGHQTLAIQPANPPRITLAEASALTLGRATMAAPEEVQHSNRLAASVDGVAFPYWEDHFGWSSTGARTDAIAGRRALTVFYGNDGGQRIGYAIVGGVPAPDLEGGELRWREHTPYRVLHNGDEQIVVWMRKGRLCIVSGHGIPASRLLRLASWDDHDTIT
jgi:hypothetical protein